MLPTTLTMGLDMAARKEWGKGFIGLFVDEKFSLFHYPALLALFFEQFVLQVVGGENGRHGVCGTAGVQLVDSIQKIGLFHKAWLYFFSFQRRKKWF